MFSSRWNNDAVTMPVNFNTVGNREQMMSARANEGLPHICDSFDSNYVGRRGRATRHYRYFVVGMKSCHTHRPYTRTMQRIPFQDGWRRFLWMEGLILANGWLVLALLVSLTINAD